MRQMAIDTGRDFDALDISVGPYSKRLQVDLDSLKRYRDLGVRRVVLVNPTTNPVQIAAALEALGKTLVTNGVSLLHTIEVY